MIACTTLPIRVHAADGLMANKTRDFGKEHRHLRRCSESSLSVPVLFITHPRGWHSHRRRKLVTHPNYSLCLTSKEIACPRRTEYKQNSFPSPPNPPQTCIHHLANTITITGAGGPNHSLVSQYTRRFASFTEDTLCIASVLTLSSIIKKKKKYH